MKRFSSMSVNQDLTVVAEAFDDVGKKEAGPSCFHARITQRGTSSETKEGATQSDAENLVNSGESTDRATMRSQHIILNYVCMQTKPDEDLNSRFKL